MPFLSARKNILKFSLNFKKHSQKYGEGQEKKIFLSLSLVLYNPSRAHLKETLKTLAQALKEFPAENLCFLIIDNSPNRHSIHKTITWQNIPTEIITGLGNLGFGKAHNLILKQNRLGQFHLILNPDIWIEKEAIQKGIQYLLEHPEIGLCAPATLNANNKLSHLGRDFPDLFSLGLRGFAPPFLRNFFGKYLAKYRLGHHIPTLQNNKIIRNVPCLSGSFLLMRGEIFKKLNGFDPKFFLYFEDFDFSLRAQKITCTAILPQMRIRHFGGNASQKGNKHIFYFIQSAFQFYQKHGWQFYKR
ncbi:glycosyltransferase [Acetobacteraceae bacterium]|nr:glycosyltransferase [Acetobacteraceae bacterium]